MAVARRVYFYGIAFVGLGMLVGGAMGLLALVLELAVQGVGGLPATIGESQIRSRASLAGAVLLIGLIAWLIHWLVADRGAQRDGDARHAERRSGIRKLFLYAVLFVGGIMLTVVSGSLVADLLRGLFGKLSLASLIAGSIVEPFAFLVVAGGLFVYYLRVAEADRQVIAELGAAATLRRWYCYGLGFVALCMLLFAAAGLIETLWAGLIVVPGAVSLGGDWLTVAAPNRLGGVASGLLTWLLIWRWSNGWAGRTGDPDPETRSVLRKVYLYLVLAMAVAWTVWNLGRVLYEVLRAVLIPARAAVGWTGMVHDLGGPLAAVLVFGIAWRYHARAVDEEAAHAGEARRQATIRWIYGHLVALVGLVTLAIGAVGVAATVLDLLVQPGAARPTDWWQEQISLFATLIVVGLPVWTTAWIRLQREADALRQSLVGRVYLFLVLGLSVLTLLGSGAFTVYQVIRLTLGEAWSARQTSELLTAACTVAVAALVLVYHLRSSRGSQSHAAIVPPAEPVVAILQIRAPSAEILDAFRAQIQAQAPPGVEIEQLTP